MTRKRVEALELDARLEEISPLTSAYRLSEDLRTRLVLLTNRNGTSLSEVVRQALELKLALHLQS